jgi:hypothetical protein
MWHAQFCRPMKVGVVFSKPPVPHNPGGTVVSWIRHGSQPHTPHHNLQLRTSQKAVIPQVHATDHAPVWFSSFSSAPDRRAAWAVLQPCEPTESSFVIFHGPTAFKMSRIFRIIRRCRLLPGPTRLTPMQVRWPIWRRNLETWTGRLLYCPAARFALLKWPPMTADML